MKATRSAKPNAKPTHLDRDLAVVMCSSSTTSSAGSYGQSKCVWIWTESKQVMTAAVERGWSTFVFSARCRELATEWSCELTEISFDMLKLLDAIHECLDDFGEMPISLLYKHFYNYV